MEGGGNLGDVINGYLEIYRNEVLPIIHKEENETRKFMVFIGSLNKYLEENDVGKIIIVGGFAAEIYTGRGYRTADVDIIVENKNADKIVAEILSKLGYIKEARVYVKDIGELIEKGIDIVATLYDKPKKPIKWKMKINNYYFYIIPPEESIISSLSSAKYWNVGIDFERAAMVFYVQRDNLEMNYLIKRAVEENVKDLLDDIIKLAK